MKYLSEYVEEATTQALDDAGAFFAFSDEQFKEQEQKGVKYCHLFGGLICPKDNAKNFLAVYDNIIKTGIAQDIKENGKSAIIKRELANHEATYTGDTESTIDALKGYNFTNEEIAQGLRELYKEEEEAEEAGE